MSKGLEKLKEIKNGYIWHNPQRGDEEKFETIEKELKALKVIIKKAHIRLGRDGDQYYFQTTNNYYYISKQKYDLLKEVLYGKKTS